MNLDDITVKGEDLPAPEVVEDFEEKGPWTFLSVQNEEETTMMWEGEAARTGESGLRFSWKDQTGVSPTGIIMTPVQGGLDIIGGPGFVPGEQVFLHVHSAFVSTTVKDIVQYFPTLDPGEGGFQRQSFREEDREIGQEALEELPAAKVTRVGKRLSSSYELGLGFGELAQLGREPVVPSLIRLIGEL